MMMNGGYRSYFGNDGYDGMQRGFNLFNNSANGPLMMVLVVALIVFVVYFIFKNKKQQTNGNEAEEIAKMRYARGEITYEEFQSILKTMRL